MIVSTDYLGRIKPGMQAQVTPTIPEADTLWRLLSGLTGLMQPWNLRRTPESG